MTKYILCKLKYLLLYKKTMEHFGFNNFNKHLFSNTGFGIQKYYEFRFYEIINLIKKYNIKTIVEIGSGRTTFLFNNFTKNNTLSIEQDNNWIEILKSYNSNWNIEKGEVISYKNGAKFKGLKSSKMDLLYIDGPYIKMVANTFTTKPAYYDFENILDFKNLPKVILVDGRTDTVDLILKNEKITNKYIFKGSFSWSKERKINGFIHTNYHSILELK